MRRAECFHAGMNMLSEKDAPATGGEAAYWELLREAFRKVCALRQAAEAVPESLRADVSRLIALWSDLCRLSPAEKRLRLIAMFDEEGRRAGVPDLARRMLSARATMHRENLSRTRAALLSGGGLSGEIRLVEEWPGQERRTLAEAAMGNV
jgi:hypothetical protein